MYVVATAGHVDHGKSTLVRALTGMEPDRWAEERRRGMTIDLGFAWTTIGGDAAETADAADTADTVAFVDVPGHERFVPNMLAGIGSVPAALVVVAADEGWMPQTEEHVAALDALEVRHAILVVTRSDLADPAPATDDARTRLVRTTLGDVEAVAVAVRPDGSTSGLDELRAALVRMVHALPQPDLMAPVRLWVDRSFTIHGSGTVVTGTLSAGSLALHDSLVLASSGREVRVRELQSLGRPIASARALTRVAVNLRGIDKREIRRGDALLTPGAWPLTTAVDVRLKGRPAGELGGDLTMHVGSAAVPVRLRPLGTDTARLTLATPLPLRKGDRLLLRDAGRAAEPTHAAQGAQGAKAVQRIVAGAGVLDADPPPLRRRGAAVRRGEDLANPAPLDAHTELRRRGIARAADLRASGLTELPAPFTGDWLVDATRADALRQRLQALVAEHVLRFPLETGPSVEAVRRALDLPDRSLVVALVATTAVAGGGSPLEVRDGRVVDARLRSALPPAVAASVGSIAARLASDPFAAPEAGELQRLRLGARELAAAERAGALVRIADGVVLLPDAAQVAAGILGALAQPFTVSDARLALRTTRRVAVPLLELLDRLRLTRRLPDGTRVVVESGRSG